MVQKLLICGLSLLFHLTVCRRLPVEYNIDAHFQATASWPTRVLYLYVSLLAARPKYYFAWTLGEQRVHRPLLERGTRGLACREPGERPLEDIWFKTRAKNEGPVEAEGGRVPVHRPRGKALGLP